MNGKLFFLELSRNTTHYSRKTQIVSNLYHIKDSKHNTQFLHHNNPIDRS